MLPTLFEMRMKMRLGACLGMCLSLACAAEEPSAQEAAKPAAPAAVRTDAPMERVGVQTALPLGAACEPATWCGPRTDAKRIAVTSLPRSLGCPATVGAEKLIPHIGTPGYADFPDVTEALPFDLVATRTLRGSGDQETCCYEKPCGSTKNADPRSAASGR